VATATLPPLATSELVAQFWIGTIPGLSTQMVATQLPDAEDKRGNPAPWVATGFITVHVVGGSPNIYLPVKNPVMQLDFYATRPGSDKPPWGVANVLAETVRYATLQRTGFNRVLNLMAGNTTYPPAVVKSAYFMTEPRRAYGDVGDYGHYQVDMAMTWVTPSDRIP
jgi:hypothetical protein